MPKPARRRRTAVLALGCAGVLTACAGSPDPGHVVTPLPRPTHPEPQVGVGEAEAHYGGLLREVTAAVDAATGVSSEWVPEYAASVSGTVKDCTFSTERLRADVTIDEATWAEVTEAVTPVLARHGFADPVAGDGTGGWLSLSAQDPSGAVLDLRSKGLTDVDVDDALVSTDGECTLPGV